MRPSSECPTAVTELLVDSLPNDRQESIESHLESCHECQGSLEQAAASQQTWESAKQYLQDDENDLQKLADGAPPAWCGVNELIDALGPTDDPRMLGRLGPYEIAGVIGSGGMGIVLKAFDPALSRFVAMKVLSPALWRDDDARERFSREARAAASIVHENVIEIYGVDEAANIPFFTMPYLRGETLKQRIDHHGPLPINEILRISKQLADGLTAAHAQGLVHRDIKPSNVLLTGGADRVRLSDFGLAHNETDDRITVTGVLAGTPSFMSPEQARGEIVDHRSDLFSLGSLIYAMCAGHSPFHADMVTQQLMNVVEAKVPRLEQANPLTPSWLAAIVARLLSKLPADRYQSAAELADDLGKCLAHAQSPHSHVQPRSVQRMQARYERSVRISRTKPILAGIAAVTAACLLGWLSYLGVGQLLAQTDGTNTAMLAVTGVVKDQNGQPVANAKVLAIQKTWPGGRYRQDSLVTKTDGRGRFRFPNFAKKSNQYAFLLSVMPEGHTLTSHYQFVKDGSKQKPVTLTVKQNDAVTFTFKDGQGKPVAGLKVLPQDRKTADGQEHMTYAMQIADSWFKADAQGKVKLSAFEPGDAGKLTIDIEGELSSQEFKIANNRQVSLTVDTPEPAGEPVNVTCRVLNEQQQPVANAKVVVVRKAWPNNRYRQDGLAGTTNENGEVVFEEFAPSKRQYAFLLTVAHDGYAMVSEYRLVEDGAQQDPVTLQLEPAEPVTFTVKNSQGKPVKGVLLSPSDRTAGKDSHMNYHMNLKEISTATSDTGTATMTAWKAGETGSLYFLQGEKTGELKFTVSPDRKVKLTLP